MKHFPARAFSAQIAVEHADAITRASRRQFLLSLAQSALCGLIGLIFGLALGACYLADLPPWLR